MVICLVWEWRVMCLVYMFNFLPLQAMTFSTSRTVGMSYAHIIQGLSSGGLHILGHVESSSPSYDMKLVS